MSQHDRTRSQNPLKLIVLLWIVLVGLVSLIGLVYQLVTLAGPKVNTEPDGLTLFFACVRMLLGIILLAACVAGRHRVRWIVDMRQHYLFLLRSFTCYISGWTLSKATVLMAPFSVPMSWVMAYSWGGVQILAGVMVVWGLKRGEGEWLRKESNDTVA